MTDEVVPTMTDRKLPTSEQVDEWSERVARGRALGWVEIELLLNAAEERERAQEALESWFPLGTALETECGQRGASAWQALRIILGERDALRSRLAEIEELAHEAASLGVEDDHTSALDMLVTAILRPEASDAE